MNDKWSAVYRDASEEEIIGYSCVIPENFTERLVFSIDIYWSALRVYLDEKEIYHYEDRYREKGTAMHWIDLPAGSEGRTLTLRPEHYDRLFVQTVKGKSSLGARDAVLYHFLQDNLYALIFGVFTLLTSAVLCAGSLYLKKKFSGVGYRGILYLGLFIFFTGCWIVSDSRLLQLVTGRTAFIALVSFLSFMVMPVFLLLFIRELLIGRKKFVGVLCWLYLGNVAFCMTVYLLRILPLYRVIVIEHILIVISIAAVLRNGMREIKRYGNGEMKRIILGFGILSVFAAAALLAFYGSPSSVYPYLYCMGIILFVICLCDAALKRVYYYLGKSARIEAYRRLAYVDTMTGMENRTAFMEEQKKNSESEQLAYIMLDINNLKTVNDRYGHQEGDRLIVEASDCIRDIFESAGTCFRIGGDEFVVVLEESSPEEIRNAIGRLERRVEHANRGRIQPIEIAYGCSVRGERNVTRQELLEEADTNMYVKKQEMKESGQ